MRNVSLLLACLAELIIQRKTIATDAPVLKPLTIPSDLALDERADIYCTLKRGGLPVTFQWYFNGKEVINVPNGRISSYDQHSSVYVIDQIKVNNVGNYSCVARNGFGVDRASGQLIVDVPPVWIQEPSDTVGIMGLSVTIECSATAYPSPHIMWKKRQGTNQEYSFIMSDSRMTVSANGSLTIFQVEQSDAGVYRCEVDNGVGQGLTKDIRLSVRVAPQVKEVPQPVSVRRGETGRLVCDVNGDLPIMVTWMKKQTLEISQGSRFEATQSKLPQGLRFELLIRDTQHSDSGIYTCIAKNQYGQKEGKVTLNVLEPPAPPRGVRFTEITSRSARVSWQAPPTANNPVSKYHVRYWRNEESGKQLQQLSLAGTEAFTYLENLHPGTSYTINVLAENGVGLSDPSQSRHLSTKEEVPSAAPTDVVAEALGSRTMDVTWKPPPPGTWNGVLKGYYIGYKVYGSPMNYVYHTVEIGVAGETNYRIRDLQKSTTYSVVVKAFTSAGSGPESQEIMAKTRDVDPPPPPGFAIMDVTSTVAVIHLQTDETKSENVIQYIIEYRKPNSEWIPFHVPKSRTSFNLTGLESSIPYEVRVAAYGDTGRGEFSSSVTFTTAERELHISYRVTEEEVPFYFRPYFVIPVASSVVVIVTTLVVAWVCYKRVAFRQQRRLRVVHCMHHSSVFHKHFDPRLANPHITIQTREGYSDMLRPPSYSPPASGTDGQSDGYDTPWDMPRGSGTDPRSGNYTRLKNRSSDCSVGENLRHLGGETNC